MSMHRLLGVALRARAGDRRWRGASRRDSRAARRARPPTASAVRLGAVRRQPGAPARRVEARRRQRRQHRRRQAPRARAAASAASPASTSSLARRQAARASRRAAASASTRLPHLAGREIGGEQRHAPRRRAPPPPDSSAASGSRYSSSVTVPGVTTRTSARDTKPLASAGVLHLIAERDLEPGGQQPRDVPLHRSGAARRTSGSAPRPSCCASSA